MRMPNLVKIRSSLQHAVSFSKEKSSIFFKTESGQYAEGDKFMGVTVPALRKIAKVFFDASLEEIQKLLQSKINEERLLALIILVRQYEKASIVEKEKIYQFYLSHLGYVNNWNLVDASAHLILGVHLSDKNRDFLFILAKSEIVWERRIAMVATWYFIRQHDLEYTFKIAKILLKDKHDLIHKAVGWMLREAGKKNEKQLRGFLEQYAEKMPRTMLRYAIEKFSIEQRKNYLARKSCAASI